MQIQAGFVNKYDVAYTLSRPCRYTDIEGQVPALTLTSQFGREESSIILNPKLQVLAIPIN
jgi:hypothetical protein